MDNYTVQSSVLALFSLDMHTKSNKLKTFSQQFHANSISYNGNQHQHPQGNEAIFLKTHLFHQNHRKTSFEGKIVGEKRCYHKKKVKTSQSQLFFQKIFHLNPEIQRFSQQKSLIVFEKTFRANLSKLIKQLSISQLN